MTWQNLLTWLLTQMLSRVVTCRWRGWWRRYLCWRGRLCGADVVGLIIFGSLCFCLPYLLWSVAAAVGDGARSGASWFCLEPAVRGKRRWCLWCRYWTGPVDPVSLLKVRALWMVVLRLVLLLGCGWWRWWLANLEPKTKSCCGGGAAGCWRQWIGVDLWLLSVIVGCDRRWCRMADRSVELMWRSSWWRVCRCDCLRRRCWGSTMNNFFFFCNQNSMLFFFFLFFSFLFFFLNQSRIKHKHVDRLIVRTIKSHALIPNLMRNNK